MSSEQRILRRLTASHGWVLAGVWVTSAVYLAFFFDRGWIPGDEGLLGQTAERVLAGELPHRDFDDTYTGGLALVHALAFRFLGIRLISIRWVLLAASLVFVPLVYRIAARWSSPLLAGGVTLLCLVWSVPNYFAGMPSWYNLYLAAGGTLALFRHVETGRRRWLFIAGLCGGVSFLFKSTGLLYLAAVFLFFLYREKLLDGRPPQTGDGPQPPTGRGFSIFVTAGLLLFVAVVISFVSQRPGAMELLLFVVPGLGCCALLLGNEWRAPGSRFAVRWRRLVGMTAPFLAGTLLPIAVFLIPYLTGSGLGSWLAGDFLFPTSRLRYTVFPLPAPATVVCVLPFVVLLGLPLLRLRLGSLDRRLAVPAALGSLVLLAYSNNVYVYQLIWFSLRPLVPVLVVLGCLLLATRAASRLEPLKRQYLFLLFAMAAMFSIVQFAYSLGIYFCYIAPLVILAYLFFVRAQPGAPWRLHLGVMGFLVFFAALWLNLNTVQALGLRFYPSVNDARLELERDGLWVPSEMALRYHTLVAEIRRHSPEGSAIYAGPDCPEVYFLSARRNPTRTFCDYFDRDYMTPQRVARLLKALEEHHVDVVVLNWKPVFSELSPQLAAAVFERYPRKVGIYPFTLHWRDRPAGGGPEPQAEGSD